MFLDSLAFITTLPSVYSKMVNPLLPQMSKVSLEKNMIPVFLFKPFDGPYSLPISNSLIFKPLLFMTSPS